MSNNSIRSGLANCLLDQPGMTTIPVTYNRLPGEDYTLNEQCELVAGSGSKVCPHTVSHGKLLIFEILNIIRKFNKKKK